MYMRLLKALMLPLIACTVISGTSSTDARSSGKIGFVAISYVSLINALGSVVGVILCVIIQPGAVSGQVNDNSDKYNNGLKTSDIIADFFRNIFPDNVIGAALQVTQTKYIEKSNIQLVNLVGDNSSRNGSDLWTNVTQNQLVRTFGSATGTNILGIIVLSATFGIAASKIAKASPFIDFFKVCAQIAFLIFHWVKWSTPLGVASLIASALAGMHDVTAAFSSLGLYILVVTGGNLAFQVLVFGTIYAIVTRSNPVHFFVHLVKPWIITLAPSSSILALPVMHEISTQIYAIDTKVTGFVIAVCFALNRTGSALFIAASCLFMAQYSGILLSVGTIMTVGLLSFLSSFAIPSVPSASIATIIIIMTTLGIPVTNIGLVLALEWINDRARTTTNMVSTQLAIIVTWTFCQQRLKLETDGQKEAEELVLMA
nr:excitatory amino acid transporter-like isoform X2 [Biomphalaria glabrata]